MSWLGRRDHDGYEEMPEHRHRGLRTAAVTLVLLLVAGGVVAGASALYLRNQISPSGRPGAEVQVTLPKGASVGTIAQILAQRGVVKSATVFKDYVRVKGAPAFQAGDYTLRQHQPFDDLIAVLRKGPSVTTDRITIPEGFTVAQIAARVGTLPGRSAQRFSDLASGGQVRSQFEPAGSNNLEGLLFPETYFVTPTDDEASILRRMVDAFDQQAASVGLVAAAARLGVTPHDVVVVASMVEREAKVAQDRGPVASVIYNRLKKGMPLQIDATLIYGLGGDSGRANRNPHQASPYNTRDTKGLPPTAISCPGRPSLDAAANPPSTAYLYYVLADKDGHHAFTASPAEFDRLVAQARAKGLL